MTTRRSKTGAIWTLVLSVGILLQPLQTFAQRAAEQVPLPSNRAVSLRVLQEAARDCEKRGQWPPQVTLLCGLRKINGYFIDAKNNDVLLVGDTAAANPPLHLEDLVVALRNAWYKYAPLRANTYTYSFPGCTIDPDTSILKKLRHFDLGMDSEPRDLQRLLGKWRKLCEQPQTVGVFGVPVDTRFAKVMVDADYLMKRIVDGSLQMPIPGFESLMDTTFAEMKNHELKGLPVRISLINRFWFYPGEENFIDDAVGDIQIMRLDVILLTEEEYLTKNGSLRGRGYANPLAKQFARQFSNHYQQIGEREPIYKELENLFRLATLSILMKKKNAVARSSLDLSYFLNGFPIGKTHVDRTLPGRYNVRQFEYSREVPGGREVHSLALPSCGGVSMEIVPKKEEFEGDADGSLRLIRNKVLAARPFRDALFWDLTK